MRKFLYTVVATVLFSVAVMYGQNDNVEVLLPGSDAVSGFQVVASDTTLLFRIGGDGSVVIPGMTKAAREAIVAPATGTLVFQHNDVIGLYYFDGTGWRTLPLGSVTTATISNAAVTTDKIAGSAVTADKIAGGTITADKLAAGVLAGALTSGSVTSGTIAHGAISNIHISSTASIDYSKLNLTNSIQSGDITANAVTTAKLADSSVTGSKILTSAINTDHIAVGAITADKIAPGVLSGALTTGSVTTGTISDSTITTADIAANAAIPYSKLTLNNSIQNGDIVANAITTSKVANGTVTTSKLADSAVSGLKLLTYAVTNRHLAANAVSTDKIDPTGAANGNVLTYNGSNVVWGSPSGGSVTTTNIVDSTITTADIAANAAIPYSKLTLNNSIQNGDIVANAITTSKVANGTVTTSKMADSAVSGLKLLTYAVTNRHLAASAVSTDKIDPTGAANGNVLTYNGSNVVWAAPSGGGSVGDSSISDNHVSASANIHVSKLNLTNGIQNSHLVANSVTTSKVANGTVTTSKMADSAISGLKLLTFAVTNRHLAAGAVTTDKMSTTGLSSGQVLTYNGSSVVWGYNTTGAVTATATTVIPSNAVVVINSGGVGAFNITLPTGADGQELTVYNGHGSTGTVTSGNVLNSQTSIGSNTVKRYIWVTANSTSGWVGQ